jgi:hypothetical protein
MKYFDLINEEIFKQNLDMDDDDPDHTFSRELVTEYFGQAIEKFGEMDTAV